MSDQLTGSAGLSAYRERAFAERDRYRAAVAEPHAAQQRVLADLLAFNAGTAFGTEHDFGRLRDLDDFRAAVPVRSYDGIEPWIERAASGESNVLSADPPLVFFTSSGSTGDKKKIPVTAQFMRKVFFPFYFSALAPLVEHFPAAVADLNGTLNLKYDVPSRPPTTASGRPHVGASQVDFTAVFGEPLAAEPGTRARWAAPVPVEDHEHLEKTYLRLRQAVEYPDLRCVVGINPAMVAALPHQLAEWWPRIVQDLHDGTLGGRPGGEPNRERAAQLERQAEYFGTLRPAHVWPQFELIYCWTTGLASLYLPRVREQFGPGVSMLPAPIAASEGPLGIPIDRHDTAGTLMVGAVLYEFIDADDDIKPDSATLTFAELSAGHEYHVIISHIGGLYRYALGDVLRVVDVVGGVPRIEYAGRNQRSDAAGERLRESQVVRAIRAALSTAGMSAANATCRLETPDATATAIGTAAGAAPHYAFIIEPHRQVSDAERQLLGSALDAALGDVAPGYREARRTGRLGAAVPHLAEPGAFFRQWAATVAAGTRQTQVKDRVFQRDPAAWQRLLGAGTTNGSAR